MSSFLIPFDGLCITLNPSLGLPAWKEKGLAIVPLVHCVRLLRGRLAIDKVELGHIYRSKRKTTRVLVAPVATITPSDSLTRGQTSTTLTYSPDFRSISAGKHKWSLTFNQSRVVEQLITAMRSGTPERGQSALLEDLDISSKRLRDVFKGSPDWKTLIVIGEKKGVYRINPAFSL